jgi:hypothetical protein
MSNTPKTDALFFPYGRDATAAAEPSLLVCMTQYELLERKNAALREQLKDCSAVVDRQQEQLDRNAKQKKPWVGLTDDDKERCLVVREDCGWHGVLDAVEAKLREKNG